MEDSFLSRKFSCSFPSKLIFSVLPKSSPGLQEVNLLRTVTAISTETKTTARREKHLHFLLRCYSGGPYAGGLTRELLTVGNIIHFVHLLKVFWWKALRSPF